MRLGRKMERWRRSTRWWEQWRLIIANEWFHPSSVNSKVDFYPCLYSHPASGRENTQVRPFVRQEIPKLKDLKDLTSNNNSASALRQFCLNSLKTSPFPTLTRVIYIQDVQGGLLMYFKMCQSVLLCVTIVWCDFAVCRSLLRAGKWLSDYLTAYVTTSQVRVVFKRCHPD